MRLSGFDYFLPEHLIASQPTPERGASRLMVVRPLGKPCQHRRFADLPVLLPKGALLILNDVRVIPARLFAVKPTGGRVELLLLERNTLSFPNKDTRREVWYCLTRSHRRLHPFTSLVLLPPRGKAQPKHPALPVYFLGRTTRGRSQVEFLLPRETSVSDVLERWGEIPLPPYIHREGGPTCWDYDRYQTVYARVSGAVAAPTAGLHFTETVLVALRAQGIEIATLTLYVGAGTFEPVREENINGQNLHSERYDIPNETAEAHTRAQREGRPIVAVGTTCVRALESAYDDHSGRIKAGPGQTELFITPGYVFRTFDQLVTNFHLPRSTLFMLVAAFAGLERIHGVYQEAIHHNYHFYSYGDAMLLDAVRGPS